MKLALTLLLAAFSLTAQTKSAFDKPTLEAYLRYSELWIPQVTVKIDEPQPSTVAKDYFDVWVHLSYNGQMKDELYYISKDGGTVFKGLAFNLAKSPFQANLDLLNEAKQPSFGAGDKAAVNLVVFGDFQCPVCQKEETDLRKNLPGALGDKVRVYFNDFPLTTIHPWAMKGSLMGRCMYRESQAAFWDYHDWIYANQEQLTLENFDSKTAEFAKSKSLDADKLKACTEDKAAKAEVDNTIAMGRSLSVSATPTLYINGRKIEGAVEWNILTQLLQLEMDHQAQAAKAAPPADDKCCTVEIPTLGGKK
ncbi:MAG TPA: thioredoxin domain-containing protein [Bryobacteraceae bacterium]|nr:thioredoxin domain-containing protein [Bryobacteraceae bacterium]